MLKIRYHSSNVPVVADMQKDVLTIGRDALSDIFVQDITVSRNHARILREGERFVIVDLGSKNGTKVNGLLVTDETELSHGDEIHIGAVPLYVEIAREEEEKLPVTEQASSKVVIEDSQWSQSEGTVVRSIADMEKFLAGEKTPTARKDLLEEENRILIVLTQVARALIAPEPLETTLNKVMDLVLKHIKASRGLLMLTDPTSGDLMPCVVRADNINDGEIRMSRTIANKVLGEKVAILSSDIQADPRFRDGESIKIMGLHSAMCAPLWNKENIIGLIHVDSLLKDTVYSERDLDLLTALGNYAAVAIERARLNEHLEREKELKSKLERYHSPQVAKRILETHDAESGFVLQATEKNVTVLFADMVGFTPMSEGMTPSEVSALLNSVFERFTEVIFQNQGTLDKFLGDAVMAVFGAPIDQQDHALRAARTAFEMLDIVKKLNEERGEEKPIAFHIGLNSGNVIAGDIGSPKRLEYTVLGSAVNIAARLQAASPANAIWAGPQTYAEVKDFVEAEFAGEKKLPGLKKKLPVYALKKLKSQEESGESTKE